MQYRWVTGRHPRDWMRDQHAVSVGRGRFQGQEPATSREPSGGEQRWNGDLQRCLVPAGPKTGGDAASVAGICMADTLGKCWKSPRCRRRDGCPGRAACSRELIWARAVRRKSKANGTNCSQATLPGLKEDARGETRVSAHAHGPQSPPGPRASPFAVLRRGQQVLTVQAGLADGLVDPAGLHHPLSQVAGFAALPARRVHLGEAFVLGAPGGSLGEKTDTRGDPCCGTPPL